MADGSTTLAAPIKAQMRRASGNRNNVVARHVTGSIRLLAAVVESEKAARQTRRNEIENEHRKAGVVAVKLN